jgi:hypothetical protein
MQTPSPQEFSAQWLSRIDQCRPLSDDDLGAIMAHVESDTAVADLIGAAACRGLLSPAQCKQLLVDTADRFPHNPHAYHQVLALCIVRDGLRAPLSKIDQLLRMSCDWAVVLAIADLGPYNCGQAFELINGSSRPAGIKSRLCSAVAAHQKALWAQMKSV